MANKEMDQPSLPLKPMGGQKGLLETGRGMDKLVDMERDQKLWDGKASARTGRAKPTQDRGVRCRGWREGGCAELVSCQISA